MSRRPSIIAGLDLDTTPASVPASAVETPPEAPPPPAPAKPKAAGRRATPDVVHTSIYLPRDAHQKLREIAFTTDRKVHDLIMEGVDQILRRHGHPPLATARKKDR